MKKTHYELRLEYKSFDTVPAGWIWRHRCSEFTKQGPAITAAKRASSNPSFRNVTLHMIEATPIPLK